MYFFRKCPVFFTDMANIVVPFCDIVCEDTITAIGLVKDGMRMKHSGKSASNIVVTMDMIHRTRSVYTKYKAFLGEQKKERELKTQKKKAAEEKAVQRAKKD